MIVALSLAAALVYGAADFCGGLATRRCSALAVVVWSQAAGLLVLLPALLLLPGVFRWSDLAFGGLCGIAGAFAVMLLYRGLAVGIMGVVSPITAVLAAAIPVAWGLLFGVRPSPLALAGIACALVAVVLVSAASPADDAVAPLARVERRHRFPPGIPEALGAGTAFGFFFIVLAQTHRDAALIPLLGTRLSSLALLAAAGIASRASFHIGRPSWRLVASGGALDMLANVLYVVAAHRGALAIVAVLTSLYPAGTVALAAIVVHERLARVQWVGVGVAFAGVAAISLG